MATFAKTTFSHSNYAAFRPTYPRSLYEKVLKFHHGPKNLCVDLGCGHGLVTRALAGDFTEVIGIDPSKGMIAQASSSTPASEYPNATFRESSAEDLSFLEDGSVDLVVSGEAAHWFDYPRLFPELKRILRKDGALAFWAYIDPVIQNHPKATAVLKDYDSSTDGDKLGPYWIHPGRDIVEDFYRPIKPPPEDWDDITRIEEMPETTGPANGRGKTFLSTNMKLGECKEFMRTWSAFHGWQEHHPEQIQRKAGGSGDVVDRVMDEMMAAEGWESEDVELDLEWGTVLLMARRK